MSGSSLTAMRSNSCPLPAVPMTSIQAPELLAEFGHEFMIVSNLECEIGEMA